jgi:hypothetical protein
MQDRLGDTVRLLLPNRNRYLYTIVKEGYIYFIN